MIFKYRKLNTRRRCGDAAITRTRQPGVISWSELQHSFVSFAQKSCVPGVLYTWLGFDSVERISRNFIPSVSFIIVLYLIGVAHLLCVTLPLHLRHLRMYHILLFAFLQRIKGLGTRDPSWQTYSNSFSRFSPELELLWVFVQYFIGSIEPFLLANFIQNTSYCLLTCWHSSTLMWLCGQGRNISRYFLFLFLLSHCYATSLLMLVSIEKI